MKRIPFDSLSLAASVREMQALVGGRLQRAVQPNERNLVLGIYAGGKEQSLLLSCSLQFSRAHLTASRPPTRGEQPPLAAAIRHALDGARLTKARQIRFDRILELVFSNAEGDSRLFAELTGKHANLILVGPDGRVMAAAHAVPKRQSMRPIFVGAAYEPPPFPPRPAVYEAKSWADLKECEGASPFLVDLLKTRSDPEDWSRFEKELADLAQVVKSGSYAPVASEGFGGYPISVSALGYEEKPAKSFWEAVDGFFAKAEQDSELESTRSRLLAPLKRVLLARELALQELAQALDAAKSARRRQEMAELILSYAHTLQPLQTALETEDYEGNPISIPLDPEKTPAENAQRLFDKAKHAKARAGFVAEQHRRIGDDRIALLGAIRRIEDAADLDTLQDEESRARERRWMVAQSGPPLPKEERPYEGHRIREHLGPGGVRVLFGENATSNDYLTQRVAKPNDVWLHVRGASSAHVVIVSNNKPERIGREALEFAAKLAVANSPSKHSGYVSVDYTLKKHVRKPRGAPPGTVTYTNEKTLHVQKAS